VIGVRPGEKLHEELISELDGLTTVDLGPYFAILPAGQPELCDAYMRVSGATPVEVGFRLLSDAEEGLLTVEEIRGLLQRAPFESGHLR
jgi:FlaA1/EpsC-like NDP-sugar epimerase